MARREQQADPRAAQPEALRKDQWAAQWADQWAARPEQSVADLGHVALAKPAAVPVRQGGRCRHLRQEHLLLEQSQKSQRVTHLTHASLPWNA